jgi:hypothetical protein
MDRYLSAVEGRYGILLPRWLASGATRESILKEQGGTKAALIVKGILWLESLVNGCPRNLIG